MTLLELQRRVNDIIAENDRRGWPERNDMPIVIEYRRDTKRFLRHFFEADSFSSIQYSIDGHHYCGVIAIDERKELQAVAREAAAEKAGA